MSVLVNATCRQRLGSLPIRDKWWDMAGVEIGTGLSMGGDQARLNLN